MDLKGNSVAAACCGAGLDQIVEAECTVLKGIRHVFFYMLNLYIKCTWLVVFLCIVPMNLSYYLQNKILCVKMCLMDGIGILFPFNKTKQNKWASTSTQLLSGPAPSMLQVATNSAALSQAFSTTWMSSLFLEVTGIDMTIKTIITPNPINSPAISCVILPSRLCFLFVCFFVTTRWRVKMWRGALHLCLSSEACWWLV